MIEASSQILEIRGKGNGCFKAEEICLTTGLRGDFGVTGSV
jgi:hypothetical protein